MKFEGTASHVATPDLTVAVNAAITLERPLLVRAARGIYEYDAVSRLHPFERLAFIARGRRT